MSNTCPARAQRLPHFKLEEAEETTGVYDMGFFKLSQMIPKRPARQTTEVMEDARIGLGLFMDEAQEALQRGDLTVDQRLHVSTILSFVEGLADRFDRVRVPGYVQKRR